MWLLSFLIVVLGIELLFLFFSQNHVITLTDEGFRPAKLHINLGDTVTFRTTRDRAFWPASNLHPTHTIYSEFDPMRPLDPDETWSFIFTKEGEWGFHDHINSAYKGTITVGGFKVKKTTTDIESCINEVEESQVLDCLQRGIFKITEEDGVVDATTAIASFLNDHQEYNAQCHDMAHIVGDAAYKRYQAGQDVPIVGNMSMCGFGFYHGFMENLLTYTGQPEKAKEFCEFVLESSDVVNTEQGYSSCFHGIGHGVFEGHVPSEFVDTDQVVRSGLDFCDNLSDQQHYQYMCATGIFNGLQLSFSDPIYNFTPEEEEDPLSICRNLENPDYKRACYADIALVAFRNQPYDVTEDLGLAVQTIFDQEQSYIDQQIRVDIVGYLASGMGRILLNEEKELNKIIPLCRQLNPVFHQTCILSFVDGLQQVSEPGKEHIYGFDFCTSGLLSTDEKKQCLSRVFGYLSASLTREELSTTCSELEISYGEKVCAE